MFGKLKAAAKEKGGDLASEAAEHATEAALGEVTNATGVEVPHEVSGAIGDAAGNYAGNAVGGGPGGDAKA